MATPPPTSRCGPSSCSPTVGRRPAQVLPGQFSYNTSHLVVVTPSGTSARRRSDLEPRGVRGAVRAREADRCPLVAQGAGRQLGGSEPGGQRRSPPLQPGDGAERRRGAGVGAARETVGSRCGRRAFVVERRLGPRSVSLTPTAVTTIEPSVGVDSSGTALLTAYRHHLSQNGATEVWSRRGFGGRRLEAPVLVAPTRRQLHHRDLRAGARARRRQHRCSAERASRFAAYAAVCNPASGWTTPVRSTPRATARPSRRLLRHGPGERRRRAQPHGRDRGGRQHQQMTQLPTPSGARSCGSARRSATGSPGVKRPGGWRIRPAAVLRSPTTRRWRRSSARSRGWWP